MNSSRALKLTNTHHFATFALTHESPFCFPAKKNLCSRQKFMTRSWKGHTLTLSPATSTPQPHTLNSHPPQMKVSLGHFSVLEGSALLLYTVIHPEPCTLHPAPCTLHPAPCTLNPEPSEMRHATAALLVLLDAVPNTPFKARLWPWSDPYVHCACPLSLSLSLSLSFLFFSRSLYLIWPHSTR